MHWFFIMDGNRRWSKKNNKSLSEGYRAGLEKLFQILSNHHKFHMSEVSFWALSTDNFSNRQKEEVDLLFDLIISDDMDKSLCHAKNFSFHIIGEFSDFPQVVKDKIDSIHSRFPPRPSSTRVNIFLNFSASLEIQQLIPQLSHKSPSFKEMRSVSMTRDLSEIDLIVRTGNRRRLSDGLFLPARYSEIYFSKYSWPDLPLRSLKRIHKHYSENCIKNFGK